MFCSKCGNQVADGQQFCQKCGAPIGQPTANQQTPPPLNNMQQQSGNNYQYNQPAAQSQPFYEQSNALFKFLDSQSIRKVIGIGVLVMIISAFLSVIGSHGNTLFAVIIGGLVISAVHITILRRSALSKENLLSWICIAGFCVGFIAALATYDSASKGETGLGNIFYLIAYATLLLNQGICRNQYKTACTLIATGLFLAAISLFGISILESLGSIVYLIGMIIILTIKEQPSTNNI